MNILFFTSAMQDEDFSSLFEKAQIKPNPSNQIFYSKLIKALSLENNVSVISARPFKKGMLKEKFLTTEVKNYGNPKYYYPRVSSDLLFKTFFEEKEIINVAKEVALSFVPKDFIILTDTLKLDLLNAALKVGAMFKTKVVGVLTDNPFNLSNFSKLHATMLLNSTRKCNAFLTLTPQLAMNVNELLKSYVFEGLVDDYSEVKKDTISNYYFFAGSLYERYGIKTLVNAFHNSKCRSKLIIAGSGPLIKYIDKIASIDSRILYIGSLTHSKILNYEANAIANINPRPLQDKLDKESVPSKLLEYLSMGVPTISTKFPGLYNMFKDDVTWFENSDEKTIAKTLEIFEWSDSRTKTLMAQKARQKVYELYNIKNQSELINHYLKTVK